MMNKLGAHLRNKFLAGILGAGPLVVVGYVAFWLEQHTTAPLTQLLGLPYIPGLGVLLAVVSVYLLGVVLTSLIGGWLLRLADGVLSRVPGLNLLYRAWKDVLVLPPGKTGIFTKVVLVPSLEGKGMQLAFTSGEALPSEPPCWCVFIPGVPNPISGQLVLLPTSACVPLAMPVEEAFKYLLSTGNYRPAGLPPPPPPAAGPAPGEPISTPTL